MSGNGFAGGATFFGHCTLQELNLGCNPITAHKIIKHPSVTNIRNAPVRGASKREEQHNKGKDHERTKEEQETGNERNQKPKGANA